ncbi:MAG: sigma-70 family RNA polymerase sigma factor [Candidatus Eremiobacteraeota bacterium]|nr:sigma-70 family RNA polymerase sigma factor [Candidatus Eremiobacteraeota bacterium]
MAQQSLSDLSDYELLKLSREKDYEAFEELVKRYEGRVYRLGLKMLHSPEDAEDLLQKTFLSVLENMESFRGDSKFSTWLFRIATNHALMKLRKEKGKKTDSLDAPLETGGGSVLPQIADGKTNIPRTYEKKEFLKYLEQAVSELPEKYRLVFILRDVEGFSNKEVAGMLDLSVPAVKSRVLRARLYLRDKLEKYGKGVDSIE